MSVMFRIQMVVLLVMFATTASCGPIKNFFLSIGKKDKEGLCPLIRPLEPQDYLRHRAYGTGSRTLDEEPRSIGDIHHLTTSQETHLNEGESFGRSIIDADKYNEFNGQLHDSVCGNMCTRDDECGPKKRCCPTTCGYACYEPVFVIIGEEI